MKKPKVIRYRDYKKFNENDFSNQLKFSLENKSSSFYHEFEKRFLTVFNNHVPIKKKTLRANYISFITKKVSNAIMKRTQLQNKYFKNRTSNNLIAFKNQRNFCTRLCKKEKKAYYNNLQLNNLTDNKRFWKTVKPLLSNKGINSTKINLKSDTKIITEDCEVAKCFNLLF